MFVADSGATEHIINMSLALSDFKRCSLGVIKSANKNKQADISIDGKGNLYLRSVNTNKEVFLTNVILAKDVSENLLSLRRFVDVGFSILLNNQILEVFDENTKEVIFRGV